MTDGPAVVGIGASAGGLEALQSFVQAIPADSGLCYVIVQHLAADQPSLMAKLLAAHSALPVHRIEDGDEVAADQIFVIPPGHFLEVAQGRFRLVDHAPELGVRTPIDRFFTSLAEEYGRNAFAVVLSGTGSDGTTGVRAIKSHGGFAIVQESTSARFAAMPENASATGLVDLVLRPADMPRRIREILDHRMSLESESRQSLLDTVSAHLDSVLGKLEDGNRASFSGYKPGTLVRRIARRIALLRKRSVEDYLLHLEHHPDERDLLANDFLISVTEFFRDPEAFATLQSRALGKLLDKDQESFRIWVPGCATGEEVYSLAILVTELMEERDDRRPWKIFGTDIDLDALRNARSGRFSSSSIEGVSQQRLDRFFVHENDHWQIVSRLREMCVFAPQNLLQDPPFSRLDLISCRNVMIYLDAGSQGQLVPRFHYALNPGGFLFLGPSETLGKNENLFGTVDRSARLFLRDDTRSASYSAVSGSTRRPPPATPIAPGHATLAGPFKSDTLETQTEQLFLQRLAPPFATVNRDNGVLYLSEAMTRFVRPSRGAVGTTVDDLLTPELRLPAHSVLAEARETGTSAHATDIVVELDGTRHLFDISAVPFDTDQELILLSLAEVRSGELGDTEPGDGRAERSERELALTRKRLDAVQREFEGAEQELRSTNEELLSMNEELQSSNEELETSREELQSINEELETINAELSENNRQLVRANSDLKNLLEATEIATLFLDTLDCVRLFTPALSRLFGVQERDIGRPIHELAAHVDYPQLAQDAEQVRRTLQPLERELRIRDTDETFQAYVRPYRTIDNRIDGVVIAFVDVTERKRNERELEAYAGQLETQNIELGAVYEGIPIGLSLISPDMRWIRVNHAMAELSGETPEAHTGRSAQELMPDFGASLIPHVREVLDTGTARTSIRISAESAVEPGTPRDHLCDFFPLEAEGRIFAVGISVRDVTREYRLESEAVESQAQLQRLFDAVPAQIGVFEGPEHRNTYLNAAAKTATGDRVLKDRPLAEAYPGITEGEIYKGFEKVYATAKPVVLPEIRNDINRRPDVPFEYRHIELQPWFTGTGAVGGVMSFAFDITNLIRNRNEIQAIYDGIPIGLALVDRDERWIRTNPKLADINELPVDQHAGQTVQQVMPEMATELRPHIRHVFETGEPSYGIEVRGPGGATTGEGRNYICDFFPVVTEGDVFAVGAAVRDITRETALAEDLRESEERLRRLFDQAPAAIAIFEGPEQRFIYSNPRHDAVLGHRELLGLPLREAVPEVEGQGIFERFDKVFETGQPYVSGEIQASVYGGAQKGITTRYFQQIIQPWYDTAGTVAGTMTFNLEITPQVEARKEARAAARRLQRLLDGLFTFVGLVAPDGTLLEANEPALRRGGLSREDVVGRKFWDTYWWSFEEESQDRLKDAIRRAAGGETLRYDVTVRTEGETRMLIDFQLTPAVDETGTVTEIFASAVDITDRAMAEERKDVLLSELEHRVKNTLAVVQSITRFTGRTAPNKDEMVKRLMSRLSAIARTHEVLTAGDWVGYDLRDLAIAETSPFVGQDQGRFSYRGPGIELSPSEAMSLGLALHELSTNAAKHGAFSSDEGRVILDVTERDGKIDKMVWTECDGPRVEPPDHTGFGSFLIGTLLERQLHAEVTMDFRPEGLVCTIEMKGTTEQDE